MTRFVFHVNKPKAERIAEQFADGCRAAGHRCRVTKDMTPVPDAVGVFYGVVPETYAAFRFYMAARRAVYLDNGWLSTRDLPTFRFSWNSAQAFLRDMPPVVVGDIGLGLPKIEWRPVAGQALLILQSEQYFEFMRLGYTRDHWERRTRTMLQDLGYAVDIREKPTKRERPALTFFEQIARAEIVVSLNSASTVKALRYGIPAFCTLDCTPSPLAPVRVPPRGRAAKPNREGVLDMVARLASYEVTREDLTSGAAVERLLSVPPSNRQGYWYSHD